MLLFCYALSGLKPAKREWTLIAAFILYIIFSLSQHAFIRGITAGPEKMIQIHVLNTVGSLLGAFFLPLLLPLRDLRERRRPSRYALRLAIAGALFLPNAIVRLLGPQVWLASSFNSAWGCSI